MKGGKQMKEDINLLRDFVSEVYRWLRVCYLGESSTEKQPRWPTIPVKKDLENLAVSAWKEFEEQYPLEKLLSPLNPERKELEEILVSHGLYGAQLRYKLHLVETTANASVSKFTGWRRKLIGIIDNIIDSLGPTGIAGALKELKDALTGSLPD